MLGRLLQILLILVVVVVVAGFLINRFAPSTPGVDFPLTPIPTSVGRGTVVGGLDLQMTIDERVNATLTALAPKPTNTPRPPPPPPTPTSSTALLPIPGDMQRSYYRCGSRRWVFEGWHFSRGYVRQLGGGRFFIIDGQVLVNCIFERTETWDERAQNWR